MWPIILNICLPHPTNFDYNENTKISVLGLHEKEAHGKWNYDLQKMNGEIQSIHFMEFRCPLFTPDSPPPREYLHFWIAHLYLASPPAIDEWFAMDPLQLLTKMRWSFFPTAKRINSTNNYAAFECCWWCSVRWWWYMTYICITDQFLTFPLEFPEKTYLHPEICNRLKLVPSSSRNICVIARVYRTTCIKCEYVTQSAERSI